MSTPYAVHARAGLGRSGLMRSGYFIPNVFITINGVDVSTAVQRDSLTVNLGRNTNTGDASFRLVGSAGIVPTTGQLMSVCLGSTDNPLFGGQILEAEHVFENDGESTPWVQVTCTGWAGLFNRRTVTYDYSGWSATDAAIHLVTSFTSGFSTSRITVGLEDLQEFTVTNEYPLDVLSKIAVAIGGGCKIDAQKHVCLWGPDGEASYYVQAPDELVPGLWSLESFVHGYDYSQVRTRVIYEGASSTCPVAIPAGTLPNVNGRGIPWSYGVIPFNGSIHPHGNYARLGAATLLEYTLAIIVSGPPATVITADVSAGDTSISVVDNTALDTAGTTGGWAHANGWYFSYEVIAPGGTTLDNIPPAGVFGAVEATDVIPAGTPVYKAHSLIGIGIVSETLNGGVLRDIPQGASLTVRMIEDDAGAQAAIAAIEGGDGVREFTMSDGNLTHEGCSWAAREQLNQFAAALPSIRWTTRDMKALPGALQAIDIPLTGGFTDTVVIDTVSISFPVEEGNAHPLPIRVCEGRSVRLQGILDRILARGV